MTALIAPGAATATPEQLPFTVIDQAVHLLDTPAEPWGIQLELGLGGHLDEERLRTAVGLACAAHPMARARQLPARRSERTWTWDIAPSLDLDPVRVVTCMDEAALTTVRNDLYSRQVVTNMVLETRVVTDPNDRRDDETLLEAVRAQSGQIKQGAGAALMEVIGGWRSLWAKQPLTGLLSLTGNRFVADLLALAGEGG